MDCLLAMSLGMVVVVRLWLPIKHPNALAEMQAWSQSFLQAVASKADNTPIPAMSATMVQASEFLTLAFFTVVFAYFVANDMFLKGSSLGKKTFHLAVVNVKTLETPNGADRIARSGIKALCLLFYVPIVLLINFLIVPLFNKNRRALHDFVGRTRVIHAQKLIVDNDSGD